jgi:uncharacterized protein (TIGR00266 family)
MNINIESNMQFPLAIMQMSGGETCRIASGAMVYHTDGIELEAHLNAKGNGLGKVMGAIGRSLVSGESVFITEVKCNAQQGEIAIASNVPGSIMQLDVGEKQYRINDYAFLAMDSEVNYTMQRQNLGKAVFGRSGGLYVMTTEGRGHLLVNSFGSIKAIQLNNARNFSVDNGHVVAWDANLDYEIRLQSGFWGSIGTGEGVINTFNGSGLLLIESLNLEAFGSAITPHIHISSN